MADAVEGRVQQVDKILASWRFATAVCRIFTGIPMRYAGA
jgi:hypothetical protein